MIVFYEKEGCCYVYVVWLCIDVDMMIVKLLLFFKMKLWDIVKEFYFENGWKMLEGFWDFSLCDFCNFMFDEWQQVKWVGFDVK